MKNSFLENPDPFTFNRFKYLFREINDKSITRSLQYEMLKRQSFNGKVLDFGGGKNAGYVNLLGNIDYHSINIDSAMSPTWVVEVGEAFPCEGNSFEQILSMNTIEHIFNTTLVFDEFYRVLKPGGRLDICVPFLFPIHGDPDDYFRPTASWFFHKLSEHEFKSVKVKPLVIGRSSTACISAGRSKSKLQNRLALFQDYLSYQVYKLRGDSENKLNNLKSIPLAYYASGIK